MNPVGRYSFIHDIMIPTKKKESNKTNQKNRDPIDTDVTIASSSLAQIMFRNVSPAAPSGKYSKNSVLDGFSQNVT